VIPQLGNANSILQSVHCRSRNFPTSHRCFVPAWKADPVSLYASRTKLIPLIQEAKSHASNIEIREGVTRHVRDRDTRCPNTQFVPACHYPHVTPGGSCRTVDMHICLFQLERRSALRAKSQENGGGCCSKRHCPSKFDVPLLDTGPLVAKPATSVGIIPFFSSL